MKPELSERLFVEKLFADSIERKKIEEIKNLEVEKLTGDASTRRYYRIEGEGRSYVVCLANPLEKEQHLSPFMEVQKLLESEGVRVPRIYDYDPSQGYFLEEDLGDQTLIRYLAENNTVDEELELYTKIIDILISIHKIQPSSLENKKCSELAFDFEKLYSEVEFTNKYLIEKFFNHKLSDDEARILRSEFTKICEPLANQKRVLTHRDFHTRNIMVINNEFVVIDFQDARMGIAQYDLVSMLEDAYYKIERSNKYELKKYYYNEFAAKNTQNYSFESFLRDYDYAAIQRVYKAIGSFAYIYSTRADHRYLKYIGYCFENLRSILNKNDELQELSTCLSKIYYEY
ncbi:MAG: phosphotransferase [Bacteriovoracaceae bacterium]|jgi:N-acetylmuramate 1-kinase|nr:phosphotransferase [Bacteriovoracaceae bacterium]